MASCVAISPAPTMPTFWIRRGFAPSGTPAFFERRSTTVKAYTAARACGLVISSPSACSSAAYPSSSDQEPAPSISSSATDGARVAPCRASSTRARALRKIASASDQSGPARSIPPLLDELCGEGERLVDELHRLQQAVGEAELDRLLRGDQAILAQRVRDDQPHRRVRAGELRRELRPSPAGDDGERDLREADMADVRRDRARVAVERELETAAEAGAVDRGDGGVRQRADPGEEVVARARALARLVARRDPRELVHVGADAEDERLARQHHRRPVAGLELVDHRHRRLERGATEGRRLAVVLAVVDRDQRDRAGAGLDPVQLEDRVRHQARSQSTAQPMPMPMQSAVSP